eukprot:2980104-Alexandrium_andersonii.AAC.1
MYVYYCRETWPHPGKTTNVHCQPRGGKLCALEGEGLLRNAIACPTTMHLEVKVSPGTSVEDCKSRRGKWQECGT